MEKKLRFLTIPHKSVAADYEVTDMQNGFLQNEVAVYRAHRNFLVAYFGKIMKKLHCIRHIRRFDEHIYIVPVNTTNESMLFPISYLARCITYSFDVWPNMYNIYDGIFKRNRIPLAFISSRQAADHLREAVPDTSFVWCPEAVNPGKYRPEKLLEDRKIDLLALGRKYEVYHQRLKMGLRGRNISYVHSSDVPGHMIFSGRDELAKGLAETRVMICFPRSMTNSRALGVETVTLRYFEAMASRCVIVGHAPKELVDLFGYNPVIESDLQDACSQIENIILNIGTYQPFVDRNFLRMLEVGTWNVRARQMMCEIDEVLKL